MSLPFFTHIDLPNDPISAGPRTSRTRPRLSGVPLVARQAVLLCIAAQHRQGATAWDAIGLQEDRPRKRPEPKKQQRKGRMEWVGLFQVYSYIYMERDMFICIYIYITQRMGSNSWKCETPMQPPHRCLEPLFDKGLSG